MGCLYSAHVWLEFQLWDKKGRQIQAVHNTQLLYTISDDKFIVHDTSALYQAGVPEKAIQERTGHLLLNGLPHYERTSDYQHHTASQILSSSVATTFDKDFSLQVSRAEWRVGCTSVSPML